MAIKSAEIFWNPAECQLLYRCVFCQLTFGKHTDCVAHLVLPCRDSPHKIAPPEEFCSDSDFIELLASNGCIPVTKSEASIRFGFAGDSGSSADEYEDSKEFQRHLLPAPSGAQPALPSLPAPCVAFAEPLPIVQPRTKQTKPPAQTSVPQAAARSATRKPRRRIGPNQLRSRIPRRDRQSPPPPPNGGAVMECDICGHRFFSRACILEHMRRQHRSRRRPEKVVPVESGGGGGVKAKVFTCEVCGIQMKDVSNLLVHKRIHTGERPYPCTAEGCDRRFSTSTERKGHLRRHAGDKPFQCTECPMRFYNRSHQRQHERTVHSEVRPYACGSCDKTFQILYLFRKHQQTHTGEKPYSCAECGNSFRQRSAYMVHLNIHSDNRPYKCSQCERGFHSSAARRSHEKIFHKIA